MEVIGEHLGQMLLVGWTVVQTPNFPTQALTLVGCQEATWNGCLEIFELDRACTAITIPGYRLAASGEVDGETQYWVIHASQDGERVAINQTASGSRDRVTPRFIPLEVEAPLDENEVFRSVSMSGLSPRPIETVLLQDGRILRTTQEVRDGNATRNPREVRRLTPQQVQRFEQQLANQRFPNFDRINYSITGTADFPTVNLTGLGSTVSYSVLEPENLPAALQDLIAAWTQLVGEF